MVNIIVNPPTVGRMINGGEAPLNPVVEHPQTRGNRKAALCRQVSIIIINPTLGRMLGRLACFQTRKKLSTGLLAVVSTVARRDT
jgi:hypothetical protein